MRSARLHAAGVIRLHDEQPPTSGQDDLVIRPTAVGLCGSDLHWWSEGSIGDAAIEEPLVVGHEAAGVVLGGPRDGELVAIDPAVPCMSCHECMAGRGNLCPDVRFLGHGRQDGALRTVLTWPDRACHTLPESIGDAHGALLEPLGVALHATRLAHVTAGDTVAVIGCGPIGLLLIQLVQSLGATKVLASDPLAHRRVLAAEFGAVAVDPRGGSPEDLDSVADVTFEVSGDDDAVAQAFHIARPGSRVALVGIPDGDRTSFAASVPRRKGLTVSFVRRMHETYPRAIAAVLGGFVDLAPIVTHRFTLDEIAAAFDVAAARRGGKVIVHPTPPVRDAIGDHPVD